MVAQIEETLRPDRAAVRLIVMPIVFGERVLADLRGG
jgi:hypothetical protein